jgi:hypothetical protein
MASLMKVSPAQSSTSTMTDAGVSDTRHSSDDDSWMVIERSCVVSGDRWAITRTAMKEPGVSAMCDGATSRSDTPVDASAAAAPATSELTASRTTKTGMEASAVATATSPSSTVHASTPASALLRCQFEGTINVSCCGATDPAGH